jgi:hypothetical protein
MPREIIFEPSKTNFGEAVPRKTDAQMTGFVPPPYL